jgi:phosphonate transport system substrate-binding protein
VYAFGLPKDVATFGVVRSHVVPEFRAAMAELCELLSKTTGTTFQGYVAPSYRDLASEVERGAVALAWAPPVLAVELDERGLAQPIAVPIRSGMTTYCTAIIARERGPSRVEELRGMRMAWVDRESSSGYVVPRIHLASLGCDLKTFFAHESFQLSHVAVVDAVSSGRADAGATFYSVDAAGKITSAGWTTHDGTRIRAVKTVVTAGPIPNDMIVVAKNLPVIVRTAVQRWLLGLDARSAELFGEIIHSREFRVPSSEHFRPLRAMMAAGRARGLLA